MDIGDKNQELILRIGEQLEFNGIDNYIIAISTPDPEIENETTLKVTSCCTANMMLALMKTLALRLKEDFEIVVKMEVVSEDIQFPEMLGALSKKLAIAQHEQ